PSKRVPTCMRCLKSRSITTSFQRTPFAPSSTGQSTGTRNYQSGHRRQAGKVLHEIPERWSAFFWCLALTTVRIGEILALQRKNIELEARSIKFGRNVWRGQIQDSTKTGEVYEKYVTDRLLGALKAHLEGKNLAPEDFVFYRSEHDRRTL